MSTPRLILASIACLALIAGCRPKVKPASIEGLELKKDELRMFEIKVPKNWVVQTRKGDGLVAYSTKSDAARFMLFGKGHGGAKVEILAMAVDSTTTIDSLVKRSKLVFEDNLDRYTKTVSTLGGKPGQKLHVEFDQEDGRFVSESYFAEQDSTITMVTFAAFGDTYEAYKSAFDEILASVKLAKKTDYSALSAASGGFTPPSDTVKPHKDASYTINIPNNFEAKPGSATAISSTNFAGERLDCTIQIDVISAKQQPDLVKIVEQYKASYPGAKRLGTSFGGQRAFVYSYEPKPTIASRAYFALKGEKLYRVTMNWRKADEKVYLPAFEKVLNSMKLN